MRVWLAQFLIGTTFLNAHPGHGVVTESEVNRSAKTLEVSMKVSGFWLERFLSREYGKVIDLSETPQVDGLILDYLEKQIDVVGGKEEFVWVGKEVSSFDTWLYFEVALEQFEGVEMKSRLFDELHG